MGEECESPSFCVRVIDFRVVAASQSAAIVEIGSIKYEIHYRGTERSPNGTELSNYPSGQEIR